MKEKTYGRLSALLLVVSAMPGIVCGCGKTVVEIQPHKSYTPESFEAVQADAVLENDHYRLVMDSETTHFVVTDKNTQTQYHSVPDFNVDSASDEVKKRFSSELIITYYDASSKEHQMYSNDDSVANAGATIQTDGKLIRVEYSFGEKVSDAFTPQVLTVENWEAINEKLSAGQKRRIQLYYTLYDAEEKTNGFDNAVKQYPALKTQPLYVLKDNLSELQKSDIDEYMKTAGYTESDYRKIVEKYNIVSTVKETAGFTIPVEYALTDDGFSATILSDLIVERNRNYKLYRMQLLPLFAATNQEQQGFFVVPDGSGAIIDMNSHRETSYVHEFYGDDVLTQPEEKTTFQQNQYLPIVGMSSDTSSYFAVVESDSANALLNVTTCQTANPANSAWFCFNYRVLTTEKNANLGTGDAAEGIYNLYTAPALCEIPKVRYMLMSADADYVEMASRYRAYLSTNNMFPHTDNTTDVILDFICVATVKHTILGVPKTTPIVLTTLSDVENALTHLYDAGIKNVSVRLVGYTKDGVQHGEYAGFSLYGKVGTREQLNRLSNRISEHGGRLYLDADFQTVYTNRLFDSFSEKYDVAYAINKKLVTVGKRNIVTGVPMQDQQGYYVSPARYSETVSSFTADIADIPGAGVAYIHSGRWLGGNYATSGFIDRSAAIQLMSKAISLSERGVLIGGGNVYALKNAEFLTDVSLYSSQYDLESHAIPFWSIVMHGMAEYSSVAYNTSENRQRLLLNSVETDAALHFTFMGANDDLLIEENLYTTLESIGYKNRIDTAAELITTLADFREAVRNKRIIAHSEVEKGVIKTVYENGVYSLVNYNANDCRVENMDVPAENWCWKGVE